jgi:hypothetical protein
MADKKAEKARAAKAAKLPVQHCGYMNKKGGIRTNWLKRWFELRGSVLIYKENEATQKVSGSIDLEICETARVSQFSTFCPGVFGSDTKAANAHEIEIVAPERTYRFTCDDDAARDTWVAALQGAMGTAAEPSAENAIDGGGATPSQVTVTVRHALELPAMVSGRREFLRWQAHHTRGPTRTCLAQSARACAGLVRPVGPVRGGVDPAASRRGAAGQDND